MYEYEWETRTSIKTEHSLMLQDNVTCALGANGSKMDRKISNSLFPLQAVYMICREDLWWCEWPIAESTVRLVWLPKDFLDLWAAWPFVILHIIVTLLTFLRVCNESGGFSSSQLDYSFAHSLSVYQSCRPSLSRCHPFSIHSYISHQFSTRFDPLQNLQIPHIEYSFSMQISETQPQQQHTQMAVLLWYYIRQAVSDTGRRCFLRVSQWE